MNMFCLAPPATEESKGVRRRDAEHPELLVYIQYINGNREIVNTNN